MLNSEQLQKYYDDVIDKKNATAKAVSDVKQDIEQAHKKYFCSLTRYYEYIRECFRPLVGKCFMEHDYRINGKTYPTVYYVITGTSSYNLSKSDKQRENPREITTQSASGYSIDDSNIFRIPATFICIKKTSDQYTGDCNACIDCIGEDFHPGDLKCLFDSEQEGDCATFTLQTGYIAIPFSFDFVDDVVNKFTIGRERIDVYRFDYVVNLFEKYIRECAQREIWDLHEKIERAIDKSIYNTRYICNENPFDEDYGKSVDELIEEIGDLSDENDKEADRLRYEIKSYHNRMNVNQRKEFSCLLKEEGVPTSLKRVNDCKILNYILLLCKVALGLEKYENLENYEYSEYDDEYDDDDCIDLGFDY